MKYRVHRIEVDAENMQEKLEQFLDKLNGDVISVIPNIRQTLMILGGAAKIEL